MCGIVGYTGYRDALPILLSSLERVTYRGYDSFGVALLNGRGIAVAKSVGTVEEHRAEVGEISGHLGIGHARWATVGGVSALNAHPHSDCRGELAIVHNGDIDNFRILRQRLLAQGHQFRSDTDSEVIAHLIESDIADDIVEATSRALGELEGPFAVVLLHWPSRHLVVARRESPLVVGIGEGETFVALDVPAILPYTNRMVYLADGDLAVVWEGGLTVWQDGFEADRPVHRVNWSAEQITKGGYDHFMLKEIHEQTNAIRDAVTQFMGGSTSPAAAQDFFHQARPDPVLLLGCGTSHHAALLGEQVLSRFLSVPVTARVASEFQQPSASAPRGLAVALSQSGETSDTLAALRNVKRAGYASPGITNVMGGSITRAADHILYTRAGPEVAVASNKSFTSQVVMLYLLAYHLSPDRYAVGPISRSLRSLPGRVSRALSVGPAAQRVAERLARCEHVFIIAKGLGVPVALEGALKFKEVAYLHTEGYPSGELKRGPFAMLTDETAVVALVLNEDRNRVVTCIKEIKARGAMVVAIAEQGDREVDELADIALPIPRSDALLAPVLHTVALQLLSYYCARAWGCPVDRPRNLAKSVTVP